MPETPSLPRTAWQRVNTDPDNNQQQSSTEKAPLTEHIISISASAQKPVVLARQYTHRSGTGLLSWITARLPFSGMSKVSVEEDTELRDVMAEGRKLHLLAHNNACQREGDWTCSSLPTSRFTGKVGLMMGIGLLAGTAGAVVYHRAQAAGADAPESFSEGERLPKAAARVAPRVHPTTSRPPIHDVKKIAIADLQCYEIVGMGRLAHKRKVPCSEKAANKPPKKPEPQPSKKYYYTENQPVVCKTQKFNKSCQEFHTAHRKKNKNVFFKNVVLNVGKVKCLCPPPLGEEVKLIQPVLIKQVINHTQEEVTQLSKGITPATYITEKSIVRIEISSDLLNLSDNATANVQGNDVKIEKLFDFSCIDDRANLSWADVIRQVGKTLASPIRTIADESLVAYYHDVLGQGCPTNQTTQRVDEITSRIDPITTQILTLLPGSQMIAVAQLIVAPALEMLADGMSGKPLDLQDIVGINQQLLFMVRQTIPTLSATEMVSLYGADPQKQEKASLAREKLVPRFSLKDDKLAVSIGDKSYLYRKTKSGVSYIFDDDDTETIAFNKAKSKWDFINKDSALIYSEYNTNNKKKYGVPLKEFSKAEGAWLQADNESLDIISLTDKDGGISEYVIKEGFLVPVEQYDISGNTISVATSPGLEEKRILLPTDYGWVFEKESTMMDDNLAVFLSDQDPGVIYNSKNKFTDIRPDGFSYNPQGKKHLKYNGRYYEVQQAVADVYILPERPDSFFVKENGIFKLRNSPDIIFAYRNMDVGYPPLEPASESLLHIEEDAYHYLCAHAEITDALPTRKIGPGVYVDDKGKMVFTVNQKHFTVSVFSDKSLVIKKAINIPEKKNINLFLCKDIYLRARESDGKNKFNYIDIEHCNSKRSPGKSAACAPLVITDSLDTLLKNNIKLGNISQKTILNTNLVEYRMPQFPNLFVYPETGRYYYLYDGFFFRAEIISSDDEVNAAGMAMLRIFTKGNIFRRKYDIANVVFDVRNGRVELKTQTDFLVEKLGLARGTVKSYLKKRKYNSIARLDIVSNVVDHVLMSKKFFIAKPREKYITLVRDDVIKNLIAQHFYPRRIIESDNIVELLKVNEVADTHPLYLRGAKVNVNNAVDHIRRDVIPGVIKELRKFTPNCENYLSIVFDTDNVEFLRGFALALKSRLERTYTALDVDRIYLSSLVKEPLNAHTLPEAEVVYHHPILTDEERGTGTLAFALMDRSKKIFINADKLYFVDPTHPDETMRNAPVISLTSALIHEASHIGKMTSDIVYFPLEAGDMIPVLDAKDDLIQKIRQGNVVEAVDFNAINKQYFDRIALYRGRQKNLMEPRKLAYLASHDPGYLAHLFLNTADGIAILARDIYLNRLVKKNN